MTTPDDVERELYRPIAETERAADQWLALALRKIARDPGVVTRARDASRVGSMVDVTSVLNAVADILEGA